MPAAAHVQMTHHNGLSCGPPLPQAVSKDGQRADRLVVRVHVVDANTGNIDHLLALRSGAAKSSTRLLKDIDSGSSDEDPHSPATAKNPQRDDDVSGDGSSADDDGGGDLHSRLDSR